MSFGLGVYQSGAPSRSQQALVRRYAQAWSRGNYPLMYSMLDAASKQRLSEAQFRAQYARAAAVATLTALRITRVGGPSSGWVPITVRVHTGLFGVLKGIVEVPLGADGSGVQFASTLLFEGLLPGEQLHRVTALGARGALLADDGTPLAEGPNRSSPIPAVADQVVGTLGPIPRAQAAAYAALGYPSNTKVGLDGLEQIFQSRLAGRIGGTLLAGKRILARATPSAGETVRTTINPGIEAATVNALGSSYAAMTVMDPRTGALLALAGFAYSDVQPPGSTMKIVTSTGALQAGIVKLGTVFQDETGADVDGHTIQNSDGEDCGGTLLNAFAVSCNSVFAPLGAELGAQRLVATAERFGFNQQPSIPGALQSTIPSAATIGDSLAVASSAIGQGLVQASTLEMADVGATIATGGLRPIPTLVYGSTPRLVRVTSSRVANQVQQMMVAVVQYGTGTSAQIPGVVVAGKTGTAELANTSQTSNSASETDAWFVGYAPAGRPTVVACALFPNAGYGGATAAPPVRQVLEAALATKGL
ncbi:MAG: penicillin-binding transpeptidase domain-containing protein [Solirubrobacteraceae bacterium]